MSNTAFCAQTIAALPDNRSRQHAAIDAFNQAVEAEDYQTAAAVCKFVLHEEESGSTFGAEYQFFCLQWLTAYTLERHVNSEDGSEDEEASESDLLECLWMFKSVVSSLPTDLNAERGQIEEAVSIMQMHYEGFELSMAAVHKAQMHQSIYMGDPEAAKRHFRQWQDTDTDEWADCPACEQHSLVEYYHFIGDYAQAVKSASAIVSGKLHCEEVPHSTYYPVIDSLIRLDRREEAERLLDDAVNLICSRDDLPKYIPQLVQLHHRLGRRDRAEELLDEFNDAILNAATYDQHLYWHYLLAVIPFNGQALQALETLAADFDQRNGNTYYQTQAAWLQHGGQVQ